MQRTVTKIVTMLVLLSFAVYFLPSNGYADNILTSLTIREKTGVTSTNYPLTFGHVFRAGDAFGGIIVKAGSLSLTTQCDIKTTWPDGSIRHAVISVLIPKIEAYKDVNLTLQAGVGNLQTGAIGKDQILASNIDAAIALTGLSGSGYSGNLVAKLREAINAQDQLKYWLKGPVCTEISVKHKLNNSLNANWEVRIYPGSPFVRISHAIENTNWQSRGNVKYDLSITQGKNVLTEVFSKIAVNHYSMARWRKVFWLGQAPPEVEIRYDLTYLVSTGMVPPYDTKLTIPETVVSDEYARWLSKGKDLMDGPGFLTYDFGTTGSRPEIGLQPRWVALYLLTMDNRMKEIMLYHGEVCGAVSIHFREDDPAKGTYGHAVSLDDRPDFDVLNNSLLPRIGDVTTPWDPDRGHQASFAYIPYLITGERWYLDEMYFWAGWDLIYDNYRRDGKGTDQDFSKLIGRGDSSNGIIYDMVRGVAWSLRNMSDAAIMAPDEDKLEKIYFREKVLNNIKWLVLGNSGNSHGLNAVRTPREDPGATTGAPWPKLIAPWQHDFIVLVLSDMIRKGDYGSTGIIQLRDKLGQFTVGRFTNPQFNKWDGAGYWWPLKSLHGAEYFGNGAWNDYWSEVLEYDKLIGKQGMPNSNFSRYNYADSYLSVAQAALSQLIHLNNGRSALSFVESHLDRNSFLSNPTWAFVPIVNLSAPKNLNTIK